MSKATPISSSGGSGIEVDNLLNVYCRLKPLTSDQENDNCMSIVNHRMLCATPPASAALSKPMYFTFSYVFPPNSTQKKVFDGVALRLVERILQGQNALLFTYGNSGSGKTYTMKGTLQEGGIMPRCLDVIFNTISSQLAKKHMFKSDKFNGFELQSEKDASADLNRALLKQIGIGKGYKGKMTKKTNSDPDLAERFIDPSYATVNVNRKNSFSVFITFIEIYNNNAYDLLEEYLEDNRYPKPPQTKVIREDSKKNMFVLGVTEVEVSSTEEAYEVFYKGLKKRRVAQTLLNAHSSRSHSVFNIRVVQADLSQNGHPGSSRPITVGQLSLVDLAGSERTSRTQNTGKVLKEAGNINNSLMSLRQCFDALRENQRGGSRVVPYRESKLTTLFKNFFEGDGFISMIICINPHSADFDENMHVLKFAEVSQDIQISVPVHKQIELDEDNRQKRLLEYFLGVDEQVDFLKQERDRKRLRKCHNHEDVQLPHPGDIFPEAGLEFLSFIQDSLDACSTRLNTMSKQKRAENETHLFTIVSKSSKESIENDDLKSSLKQEKEKYSNLEYQYNILKRKFEDISKSEKRLKRELLEKEKAVLKSKVEKDREKEKFMQKKNVYKEKYNSELEKRLKRQRTELEMEIQSKENKLARVQRVLSDEIVSTSSTPSVASCRAKFEKIATPISASSTPRTNHYGMRPSARRPQVAVSNQRHRRSKSAGDVWVEHKPAMPVPLNTLLQPQMAKRRSITKLTDAKQVTQGASKYCLMTQTQDSEGDLETRFYKGDVIPTSGGGAQVLFNDVEVLKQVSPDVSPKRHPRDEIVDPQPTCSYAIEGHRIRSRRV